MSESTKSYIELIYDENQSYEYFAKAITSNFSIPETQAEQLYYLLRIGGKTTMFSNKSKDELTKISEILDKCKLKNVIVWKEE
jgi:hypothetical protein